MKTLTISHLTKVVKQKTLLDDVSFSFSPHHIYAVVGDNGAGKTTLLRCLLGLSQAIGIVQLGDEVLSTNHQSAFLQKVGAIFPLPDSYDDYSVNEVLDNHLHYYELAPIDKESYLKSFGLHVSLDSQIGLFSLGMKQRLNIALAFLHNPDILILDEPFNGLDRDGSELLQGLLLDCQNKEKIIILSSHSFSELESTADTFLVLHKGKLVATTNLREIKQKGFNSLEEYYKTVKEGGERYDTPHPL